MPEEKIVGKLTQAEVEKLQKDSAELAKMKAEYAALKETQNENEQLRKAIAEREAEEAATKRKNFRTRLAEAIAQQAVAMNEKKFAGKIPGDTCKLIAREAVDTLPDSDIDKKYIADSVDGFDNAVNAAKAEAFKLLQQKANEIEGIEARYRKREMIPGMAPNLNTLPKERRELGMNAERTYFNDETRQKSNHSPREQLQLMILSAALDKEMIKDRSTGETWLHEHAGRINETVKAQRAYAENQGVADGDFLSPGGQVFHALAEHQPKLESMFLSEANEMTSANVIGASNLAIDFSSLVVQAAWPRLIAKRIAAQTGVMRSAKKSIWEIGIPRSVSDPMDKDKHWFGAVDSDTPTTLDLAKTLADGTDTTDDGALSDATNGTPREIWAYLGEVVDANTTITATVTLPSGSSSTATVTFATTDAVGTMKPLTAAGLFGDVYTDVTAVSSTGWTDAAAKGEVGFFAKKPMTEITAGSQADKSAFSVATTTVTATSYNKMASLTLEAIEDLRASLNDEGVDGVAMILRLLSNDVLNVIDQQLFYSAITTTYSANQTTFSANSPSAGYSDLEWKAKLHLYMNDMMVRVLKHSGQMPNRVVWSTFDWPTYTEWLTQSNVVHRLHPDANDPFADGKARFEISGAEVYLSENLPVEYVLECGSQLYGIHSYDYIPLRLMQADNPNAGFQKEVLVRTRGYHGIPDDDKVNGGQAVGLINVSRR